MNGSEFSCHGKEMIDYIQNYLENIAQRRVTPNIEPGYLKKLLPDEAPYHPEKWTDIMADVEQKIMPGVTHWQHPRFHAYFPSGNSYPSIMADILSAGIGCIGFSWAASPACTELETIVLDWFGKAIGLPNQFLSSPEESRGGGVIQTSASECTLVAMLAARAQAIKRLKQQHPHVEEGLLLSKLMGYCSREAHSSVEKDAMISFVKLRILEPDDEASLTGETVRLAMEEDESNGLVPFFVSTTLGTTSCCSFDNIKEIGEVVQNFPCVWLHVDAAYAGNAFICPELKYLLNGIEYADSFNTNPNKFLLTNFDCSCMWVRDRYKLTSALVVDPLYLQHGYSNSTIDYRHWGVPLSRRFRSLKLWFVFRSYGISGLQAYIRHHIKLAKKFEDLVRHDVRFELCHKVVLGLVCFRLKGSNRLNDKLLSNINESGKLHMVPASVKESHFIRFCVVAQHATEDDINYAWDVIKDFASELLDTAKADKFDEWASSFAIVKSRPTEPDISDELQDEVFELSQRSKKDLLAYKRSFFVRMVSDPKIYNPSIAASTTRKIIPESPAESNVTVQSPSQNGHDVSDNCSRLELDRMLKLRSPSWISWPLAFLFQNKTEDKPAGSNVPLRFRHWDTRVGLNPGSKTNGGRRSPSPDFDHIPRRSPNSLSDHTASPKRSPNSGDGSPNRN